MLKRIKMVLLLLKEKLVHSSCTCQQGPRYPCNKCIESWMNEKHIDLSNSYKKLPEPLRQQTIDRQMRLYKEFIDEMY